MERNEKARVGCWTFLCAEEAEAEAEQEMRHQEGSIISCLWKYPIKAKCQM